MRRGKEIASVLCTLHCNFDVFLVATYAHIALSVKKVNYFEENDKYI